MDDTTLFEIIGVFEHISGYGDKYQRSVTPNAI